MTVEYDLVFEMAWEDFTEFETLESVGLENGKENDTIPEIQLQYYTEEF
jgi:hypothetical protein